MYHICHIVIVTWPISISCVASLPFINPLLLPDSKVSIVWTLQNHNHSTSICLLFYDYCEFRHNSIVTYCFLPTIVYREVYDFGCSPCLLFKLCWKWISNRSFLPYLSETDYWKRKRNVWWDHLPLADEMEADFAVKVAEFRWTWIIGEACCFSGRLRLQFN